MKTVELDNETIALYLYLRKNIFILLDIVFRNSIDEDIIKRIDNIINHIKSCYENSDKNYFQELQDIIRKQEEVSLIMDEYARIFYSVDNSVGIYPYESVYLSPSHLMMQKERDDVVEFFADCKYYVNKDYTEPEDHICIELSFMIEMYAKMIESIQNDDLENFIQYFNYADKFFHNHYIKWVPLLARDLKQKNYHKFYQLIGYILETTVNEEREFFNEMKGCLEYAE